MHASAQAFTHACTCSHNHVCANTHSTQLCTYSYMHTQYTYVIISACVHTHTHSCAHTQSTHALKHLHIHAHVHTIMFVQLHTAHKYTHSYMHTQHIHYYKCTHTHACMHSHTHALMYTHPHTTNTHTHLHLLGIDLLDGGRRADGFRGSKSQGSMRTLCCRGDCGGLSPIGSLIRNLAHKHNNTYMVKVGVAIQIQGQDRCAD